MARMSIDPDLADHALMLPVAERAELAQLLILSLESEVGDPEAEQLWDEEIQSRIAALDRGEAQTVDWREAVAGARDSLKRINRQ